LYGRGILERRLGEVPVAFVPVVFQNAADVE
jgi:hypothetical protein